MPLDLPHRPAFGAEDFFLSKSNELAVRLIDDWPRWVKYGQMLVGPEACGKTHLVNVWRLRSDAQIITASRLNMADIHDLDITRPVCIEDIDRGLRDEEALFHLLNVINAHGNHILVTSRTEKVEEKLAIRDLCSRLKALPVVAIKSPDDQLLKAVMVKQFADRQIKIDPLIVEYLFRRMERSMLAVAEMVAIMDQGSLEAGRSLTRPLAREILMAHNIYSCEE